MITCTRRFGFDAGHRVTRHESKCRSVHGHRYTAEVTVAGAKLDFAGRVIDYGVLKEIVGKWIDDHLDHGYIFKIGDPVGSFLSGSGHKTCPMPEDLGEPTAENLAAFIARASQALLAQHNIEVVHVRVYETPNCWADWKKRSVAPLGG